MHADAAQSNMEGLSIPWEHSNDSRDELKPGEHSTEHNEPWLTKSPSEQVGMAACSMSTSAVQGTAEHTNVLGDITVAAQFKTGSEGTKPGEHCAVQTPPCSIIWPSEHGESAAASEIPSNHHQLDSASSAWQHTSLLC